MGRGLGPRQQAILEHLEQHGPSWASELRADDTDTERVSVGRAISGLRSRGLVRTKRAPNPGRLVEVDHVSVTRDDDGSMIVEEVPYARRVVELLVWLPDQGPWPRLDDTDFAWSGVNGAAERLAKDYWPAGSLVEATEA